MVTPPPTGGIHLPAEAFDEVFPFHFAFGSDWRMLRSGRSLARVCPQVVSGARFIDLFTPVRPEEPFDFEGIVGARRTLYLIREKATGVLLRGQMLSLRPSKDLVVFLGSPWLPEPAAIAQHGLSFDDFAIHDPALDLLQVLQSQKMAVADLKRLATKLQAQRAELRESNEKLRRQEAEYRKLALIAARTDNAVVLTDARGVTEWVNEGFVRLTGFTLEEARGQKPGTLLQGPETDPATVNYIRQQLAKGEGFSVELVNYSKSRRKYWLAIEVQPIHDDDGRIANFMAIETDITQRKLAERRLAVQYAVSQALAESQTAAEAWPRILQCVCEQLGWQVGAVWQVAPPGKVLRCLAGWVNAPTTAAPFIADLQTREFTEGVGLPGRVWASGDCAWIPDVVVDSNFPRAALAAGENLHGAFGFPIRAGGEFWGVLEFFSRHFEEPDEALLRMFGAVGNQIGQFIVRKAAETALQQTNTLQRAILDSATYLVIATTEAGTIVTFNRAAEQTLGYRAEEVVGRVTPAVFHVPDEVAARAGELTRELGQEIPAGFAAFVAKARLGLPDEREWTYVRKDGSRFPVRLSVTALFDDAGAVTGYLGVASDITEPKRVGDQLVRAKEAAEAANRAKSEFLAMMSHEIRTPMNGVLGMTELLLRTALDRRQVEFAEGIAQSANALLHVIDDVLDFSKIEAGKLAIVAEEFAVSAVLDAVLEVASHREPEKRVSLAGVVGRDVPTRLRGDPQRLRQVLLNLVGNAVKFTPEGEVTVRVHTVADTGERLRVRFEVSDTGIGLLPEQMERLFQPFMQADQSASRRFGGTGLGLAISRRLVELMGGTIGATSEPGQGSTFWFELPLERPEDAPAPRSHPALAAIDAVLGVEHAGLAESLREQLGIWGVSCASMVTGAEVVDAVETALRRQRTPVVICEDDFLVKGGVELRRGLRRVSQRACYLLLSNPAGAASDTAAAEGFRTVLLKPVKMSHLFDALVTAAHGVVPVGRSAAEIVERQEPAGARADRRDLSHLRILLAEDHHINRRLCLLMLEEFGATADTAENGNDVLAALTRREYDLILMDCNMPELDGYQATQAIRQLESLRGPGGGDPICIVALTANALIGERERCLSVGMNDYLTKPFTAQELRSAILRATGRMESATPAADPSRLDQLAAELDTESVAQMVTDYLDELPGRLEEMDALLVGDRWEELARAAHSLRGVSASFGLDELGRVFGAAETAAVARDLGRTRDSLAAARKTAEPAADSLRQWLDALAKRARFPT